MKKHIDDIFKEQFKEFEAPVSDGLWDKIQQNPSWQKQLRRQKIRNLSIYGFLAVAVISSCAVLLHQRHHTDNQLVESTFIEESTESVPQTASTASVETKSEMEESVIAPAIENAPVANPDNASLQSPANEIVTSENKVSESTYTEAEATEIQDNTNNSSPSKQNNPQDTKSADKKQENKSSIKSDEGENIVGSETTPQTGNTASENQHASLFSIPNAFTPNGDGLNDVFRPITAANIQQYQLDIFSMSGQHIFSSKNLDYGWNGEFQGSISNSGSYIYVIKYKDENGKEHIDKGQLLLIR